MTIKRSFLRTLVRIRRIWVKKRIEKRRAAAIGRKAKRTITVTDPKALDELRKISGVTKKNFMRVQLVLTTDKKVYLLYGKRAPSKTLLLSGKLGAFRVVRNVLQWNQLLNKKKE